MARAWLGSVPFQTCWKIITVNQTAKRIELALSGSDFRRGLKAEPRRMLLTQIRLLFFNLFLCVHASLLIDSCEKNSDSITGPLVN